MGNTVVTEVVLLAEVTAGQQAFTSERKSKLSLGRGEHCAERRSLKGH